MSIQASKLELVKLIVEIDNDRVITKLLNLLKSEENDLWTSLSESEKEEIELGIKQLDLGQRISLEDFQEKISH